MVERHESFIPYATGTRIPHSKKYSTLFIKAYIICRSQGEKLYICKNTLFWVN